MLNNLPFLYFAFIVSSCNEKFKVGEKPTNLKSWVEYQKIKEHESGNNYFPGYEYELINFVKNTFLI